jgi:hypothetical protein
MPLIVLKFEKSRLRVLQPTTIALWLPDRQGADGNGCASRIWKGDVL